MTTFRCGAVHYSAKTSFTEKGINIEAQTRTAENDRMIDCIWGSTSSRRLCQGSKMAPPRHALWRRPGDVLASQDEDTRHPPTHARTRTYRSHAGPVLFSWRIHTAPSLQ